MKDSTHHFKLTQEKKRLVDNCPLDCTQEKISQCGANGRRPEYCAPIRKKMEDFIKTLTK